MRAYKGNIVHTPTKDSFECYENGYCITDDSGIVTDIIQELPVDFQGEVTDYGDCLLIPGFTDLHMHPFQYSLMGNGYDRELLQWCRVHCGPAEALSDVPEFAERLIRDLIHDMWKFGLLHSVMFPTMNGPMVELLMQRYEESGLYAYIGKCQDDLPLFDLEAGETLEDSMKEAVRLAEKCRDYEKVKYIFTVGWSLDASKEMMDRIREEALRLGAPFQSHLDENRTEVKWVLERRKDCKNYAETYEASGVFGGDIKTVMAHCIHTTEEEIRLLRDNGVYVAHCPCSNFNLASGVMPLRRYLEEGIRVGIGSDISAGHTLNMMENIRSVIQASKWYAVTEGRQPVSTSEAFYLATKGGGAFFGKVGSFEKGYHLNALVIDDSDLSTMRTKEHRSLKERVEGFLYLGDDRQIVRRLVNGKEIFL